MGGFVLPLKSGGSKKKIDDLLKEYVGNGDKAEACRCIRELNVPFYHHEVVKKALTLAMEKTNAQPLILSLLQEYSEEGLITSNQLSKGFRRVSDALEDLALDIPKAQLLFNSLISKAIQDGWLVSRPVPSESAASSNAVAHSFKLKATIIIQEYFLSDDISEVIRSLEDLAAPDFHAAFVKRLVMLAMDRKNQDKEMASVLLSALYTEVIPIDQIGKAFTMLLLSAEDTLLDIPDAASQLAFFLAQAVVDDILPSLYLEEINELNDGSLGSEVVHQILGCLCTQQRS